jgi:hypothetical protein
MLLTHVRALATVLLAHVLAFAGSAHPGFLSASSNSFGIDQLIDALP